MGPGTSPILFEDLLIVQADQEMGANSALVALDKTTGREVWRTARTTRRSWATPLIVRAGARTELIAAGRGDGRRLRPAAGKELWRASGTESHPIPSAVAGHGLVFFTAGSQAKRAMAIRPGGEGDVTDSERDRLDLSQGHGVRAVADPARRLSLSDDRRRPRHLPRREDRAP